MSEGIQISEELISGLIHTIGEHDAEAKSDRIIVLQYLAAVSGFLAADYPGPDTERDELLEHMAQFSQYVCQERVQSKQQSSPAQPQAAAPQGRSTPTDDPAVGIWKPE